MTTRIDRRFAALKAEGRAALVTFIMTGDPDYDTSLARNACTLARSLSPRPERLTTIR